jgi:hypothetical protein
MLAQATAFMGVSKDATRSAEDIISTPEPGESLAIFYARSRKFHSIPSLPFGVDYLGGEYWTQKAHAVSDNRGKQLRRDGFSFAEERYGASNWSVLACELQLIHFVPSSAGYKPILEAVEKILAEAGLDEDEMRAGAASAGGGGSVATSRNRR